MLPLLKQGKLEIGVLPEPAATQLTKMASDKTWYRTDLQALYDNQTKAYPQAVVLIKQSFLNTYPSAVTELANAFGGNVNWVKENTTQAVNAVNNALVSGEPSLKSANITAQVVDNCKIYWQSASDAKQSVNQYLNDIISLESNSAKTVDDGFYYTGSGVSGQFTNQTVTVFAPDGAPALAIAKFINDNETFGTEKTFEYKVVSSSDIGSKVASGAGDIVILPINAASKLYKSHASDTYQMAGVVTHGNLYIMSSVPFITLANKNVGVIGQGLVPDLTFRTILNKNKLEVSVKA